MSKPGEHKRVAFTTISTQRSIFNNNEGGFSSMPPMFSRFGDFLDPDAVQTNKSTKSASKTVRLELELFETDSSRYPEFNYSKLVFLEKKKAKMLKGKSNHGSTDPFADNDDDVARIAKELEAKYGNAYARGRGKRKKDDFCDIGMGYDESDSFIDNTEAYDEILPEEVETLEGGFYINCGALEFKNLHKKSSTRRTDAIIKMPERSRKRAVSTSSDESSESSSDSSSDSEQKQVANSKNNIVNNNNNGDDDDDVDDEDDEEDEEDDDDDDDDGDSDSDSESIDGSDSDSESLDDETSGTSAKAKSKLKQSEVKGAKSSPAVKQKANNNSVKKPSSKVNVTPSSSSNSPRPITIDNSDTEERQAQALKKVVKTTTVKDMLKAKRDSFLKSQGQLDGPAKATLNGEVKCTAAINLNSSSDSDDTDSASEQGRVEKQCKTKDGQENLRPSDTILPPALDRDILANINCFKDLAKSRDLCGKRFFFDGKLTELLLKIYEALLCTDRNERNMVFAHLEYQLQLPKYYVLRKAKLLRAREEKIKTTNALERLRKAVAEVMPKAIANYEIELHKFAELAAADVNAEHPPMMPRKKFQWTNDLRERLYEVYQARWTSYAVLGKRKDSLEKFINGYLKDKIVDVWATGWMCYEELQREIEKHKSASRKLKAKARKTAAVAPAAASSSPAAVTANTLPSTSNYLKQLEELPATEQSQSRANSDTDSATSASSSSVKRKLELPAVSNNAANPQQKPSAKPPKIKFQKQLAATLAQMSQANNAMSLAPVTIEPTQVPSVNSYLKQLDELTVTATASQSRSCANSDTDSVKSASSTGLKRKLENHAVVVGTSQTKQTSKKKKQQQASPQPIAQLDTIMSQPSTSAQAAALNAAVVAAAASMLELASPTKADHNIYKMITAASTNPLIATAAKVSSPINSLPCAVGAHSTTSSNAARPVPHVINLDDYKSPSDILQTSQQLAASKWQSVQESAPSVPPVVVRCESSSESDGVEFVGIYPAVVKQIQPGQTKPKSRASQKSKPTSVISATGSVPNGAQVNGSLGFNLENLYVFNNNNAAAKMGVIRSTATNTSPTALGYDLSRSPQIMKKLSELSALEKQMNWSQCSLMSGGVKGATGAGAGTGSGAGAGTSTNQ